MLTAFRRQPTKEEYDDIRAARTKYQDTLAIVQATVSADIQNNKLTPETGSSIMKIIQSSYSWLRNNPNAYINEITGHADASYAEIRRLYDTNLPKAIFYNTILVIPAIVSSLVDAKHPLFTSDKEAGLLELARTETKWFNKNQATASKIDFVQEMIHINTSISSIVVDTNIINYINWVFKYAHSIPTSQLKSQIAQQATRQKKIKEKKVDVKSSISIMLATATQVFFGLLVTVLCIISGSLSANLAIGRIPSYRILYFIYGLLPFFAPLVYIYAIYIRIKEGRISVYSILPLSIEPATTRLGKILWYPFYWIPDQHAIDMYKKFTLSLAQQVI